MTLTRWTGAILLSVLATNACSSPEETPTQPGDTGEAAPAAAPKPVDGEVVFLQCGACHALDASAGAKIGPHLAGIVGRKAASIEGFAYSDAMKSSQITWTREELERFLEKPMQVVPGTKMAFAGRPDAERRAALIDYLEGAEGEKPE